MWRKGSPFALLVGMQIGAGTVESSVEVPEKIKNISAFSPSDPTSGNISKETPNTNSEECKLPLCSLQHYLQSPRYGSSPSAHQ